MIQIRLNTMGLKLCPIGIGCEPLGNVDWGIVDVSECKRAIQEAFANGVNVFDTADVYGLGSSEESLSSALGKNRHNAFIISKGGVRWENDGIKGRAKTYKDSSPDYMIKAIENSLRRLRLETIPLYFVHWPDEKTPIVETLEALDKARKAGKILNYGLSNFSVKTIKEVVYKYPIAAIQTEYNLLTNIIRTKKLLDFVHSKGLYSFTYGPLAQGLLSGKYNKNSKFSSNDRRHRLQHFSKDGFENNQFILNALEFVADKHNKSVAQVAIRWCIDSKNSSSTLIGIKSYKQFKENYDILNWSISEDERKFLEKISNKYTN